MALAFASPRWLLTLERGGVLRAWDLDSTGFTSTVLGNVDDQASSLAVLAKRDALAIGTSDGRALVYGLRLPR